MTDAEPTQLVFKLDHKLDKTFNRHLQVKATVDFLDTTAK
jgi:hypothetical protein